MLVIFLTLFIEELFLGKMMNDSLNQIKLKAQEIAKKLNQENLAQGTCESKEF